MERLTIDSVKNSGMLIFEAIAGSRSYGLDTAKSDTDIRGVFVMPEDMIYGMDYVAQVNNESNDIVYYELKRFIELLSKNNPNILEILNIPAAFIIQRHAIMDMLSTDLFLSKLSQQSFANYAYSQIRKAYGLEKKIMNPVDEQRKSVLDFCFVYTRQTVTELTVFLQDNDLDQDRAGLTALPHLRDCYNMFYSTELNYEGIIRKEESNDVALSSIPKGEQAIGLLYFNRDAYSVYCKKYREYWEWVNKRNEDRYDATMKHGKNYDSKNMMHVFRLLKMAKEIAMEKQVNVHRKDREFLLAIKEGRFEYDELLAQAEQLKGKLPVLFEQSDLPDEPDRNKINEVLVEMRRRYYNSKD